MGPEIGSGARVGFLGEVISRQIPRIGLLERFWSGNRQRIDDNPPDDASLGLWTSSLTLIGMPGVRNSCSLNQEWNFGAHFRRARAENQKSMKGESKHHHEVGSGKSGVDLEPF